MDAQEIVAEVASRGILFERALRGTASRHPYAVLAVAAAIGAVVGVVAGPPALRRAAARAARRGLAAGGLRFASRLLA